MVGPASPFPGFYSIAAGLTAACHTDTDTVYALARKNLTADVHLIALDLSTGKVAFNQQVNELVDAGSEIGMEQTIACGKPGSSELYITGTQQGGSRIALKNRPHSKRLRRGDAQQRLPGGLHPVPGRRARLLTRPRDAITTAKIYIFSVFFARF